MDHSDYPNPERLARFMHAFDDAMREKDHAHLMVENLKKSAQSAQKQMEDLKKMASDEEPTIVYVPRQSKPRRRLNPFSMLRYIRDNIRLRKYNDEWIKANIK
jgi:hypothetical protein